MTNWTDDDTRRVSRKGVFLFLFVLLIVSIIAA